jgi:hypothetical protein
MMGTKTNNFSDKAASQEDPSIHSVNPVVKVPGSNDGKKRSKEELSWQSLRKSPIDLIRKSSIEETDLRESSSGLRKSVSNPLKSIWSNRRAAGASTEANQPCIVELRSAKNLPVMGSADDNNGGTNPFVTMKVRCVSRFSIPLIYINKNMCIKCIIKRLCQVQLREGGQRAR